MSEKPRLNNAQIEHLLHLIDLVTIEVKQLREYNDALLNWMMNHLDRDEDEIKEMIYE